MTIPRFSGLLAALLLVGLCAETHAVHAQSDPASNSRLQRSAPQGQPAHNLPDWAAPSPQGDFDVPEKKQGGGGLNESPTTDQPSLPGDPTQVPVDGGLSLLALAGAGYAVRRLRQQNKEDDETGDDLP
jgi:hypothetical protein